MPNRGNGKADDRRRQPRVSCRLHGRITQGREKIRARIVDISEGGLCLLSPAWLEPKKPLAIAIEVPGRETAMVHVEIWHIRREKSRTSNSKVWVAGAVLRDADTAYAQLLTAAGLVTTGPIRSAAESKPAATATSATSSDASSAKRANPTPAKSPASTSTPAAARSGSASPTQQPPQTPTRTPTAAPTGGANAHAPATAAEDVLDELEPRVFRLRCKAKGSPRTRVLSLAAESVEEANKLATRELGAEWDILEVLEA